MTGAREHYEETCRFVVGPDDCDALGHMNVQHYLRAVSDGMFGMMERLGLDRREIERRRLSFAVVRAEADFKRELHAGQTVALDSTILEIGEKLVVFHHHLRIVPGGEIAMSIFYRCVLLDLDRRRAVVVPGDIRAAARARFPGMAEG